jgi:ketosteroid isomerase-like protein
MAAPTDELEGTNMPTLVPSYDNPISFIYKGTTDASLPVMGDSPQRTNSHSPPSLTIHHEQDPNGDEESGHHFNIDGFPTVDLNWGEWVEDTDSAEQ